MNRQLSTIYFALVISPGHLLHTFDAPAYKKGGSCKTLAMRINISCTRMWFESQQILGGNFQENLLR